MKPTILLDVDGVVANFLGATLNHLDFCGFEVPYSEDEWKSWSIADALSGAAKDEAANLWRKDGFAMSIPHYAGVIEGVARLSAIANIYFVTSPLRASRTWHGDREAWLRFRFPNLANNVIHTNHKFMVRGDMLIDDKPEHVEQFLETGRTARLFRRSYNDGLALPYVNNWQEVYDDVADLIHRREKDAEDRYWREIARNLP